MGDPMARPSRAAAGTVATLAAGLALAASAPAAAQQDGHEPRGSDNVSVVAHVPLEGGPSNAADVELEQDLSRPFAYVSRARYASSGVIGLDVVDLSDPAGARVIHTWRIRNAELHRGPGALDPKLFQLDDRHYLVQSFQFAQGGPDAELGAVVFDVTDLPDDPPEEVARISYGGSPGGFHNIFMYHHSDDRALLFATTTDDHVNVYDMRRVVEGEDSTLVAEIPVPENPIGEALGFDGYHDFYVGWHPPSRQDRFYGGGAGGYYVFDVTELDRPELLASVTGVPGVNWGHTITPSPDGRYIVTETEYQYAPLRIFDLKPALDGEVENVDYPVSVWTADWHNLPHNHEMRWPYVFVSAYEDGLQVFEMTEPEDPKTVAWYDTYPGPHAPNSGACSTCAGAFGVDVRDADGLVVLSDDTTGFWAFRMEGFGGWDGDFWGVPDVSSAQDWQNAPGSRAMD